MISLKLAGIVFLLLVFSFAKAQDQYKHLILTPNSPDAGKRVQFTYDPSNTPLASSQAIHAIAKTHEKNGGQFVMTAWDVDLAGNGNEWKGSFIIPDSCVSFFVVIKDDTGIIDANDGEGYLFTLQNDQGEALAGGKASLTYRFLETYSSYGFTYNQTRASKLLADEFQAHPSLKSLFFSTYVKTVDFTNASATRKLRQEADAFYKDYKKYSAAMLKTLHSLYNKLGQERKAEKCMRLLLKEFPESYIAFQWRTRPYQEDFFKADTREERLSIHHDMVRIMEEHMNPEQDLLHTSLDEELPTSSYERHSLPLDVLRNERYSCVIQLIQLSKLLRENYWEDGDIAEWISLIDSSKYSFNRKYLYNTFAEKCLEEDTLLERAYEMSTRAVHAARQHLDAPRTMREASFTHSSESEIKLSRRLTLAENLVTQAKVLQRQNKTQEALDTYREASKVSQRLSPEVNEHFATFLIDTEMFNEARREIKQAIRAGKHTLEMEAMLKDLSADQTLSTSKDGTRDDGAHIKQDYLKSKTASIRANMLDIPATDFKLGSLEGDTVQLSNLKGKVVVLDFWAIWCAPCIASFPGMQKAVEKYQNDPDVAFLFINLDEPEVSDKIRRRIHEAGYDFKVLMDPGSQVGPAYSVHGIPVKFIIDRKGIIRFRKGSFEPNIKDEVEDLSIMIDLALQES